jgi:GNAT superfamily N-acetyltransferase
MKQFVAKQINEQELLDRTSPQGVYDAIYLCSALVLPEHRGKGVAKRLTISAIQSIQVDHPIKHLFYWGFSVGGTKLATSVARDFGLPLHKRPE